MAVHTPVIPKPWKAKAGSLGKWTIPHSRAKRKNIKGCRCSWGAELPSIQHPGMRKEWGKKGRLADTCSWGTSPSVCSWHLPSLIKTSRACWGNLLSSRLFWVQASNDPWKVVTPLGEEDNSVQTLLDVWLIFQTCFSYLLLSNSQDSF